MNPQVGVFRKGWLAAVLIVMAAAQAAAFTLSPMSVTIATTGSQSVTTFRVSNDSDQPIAVMFKAMTRKIGIDGIEVNVSADKDFLIFPARLTVPAKSFQNVKVQYRGDSKVKQEIPYRIIAEQLPVDFTKQTTSGVNILIRYVAALYVTPANVAPKITLVSTVGTVKSGKSGLAVEVKNEGTKHALLYNTLIRFQPSPEGAPVVLTGEPMTEIEGQNLLPLSSLVFFVPWEPAVMGAAYDGAFSADIE